jgi:hypothetical protein
MALNWLGAPKNSLRTFLVSSITARKSPTLNPKLILAFALLLVFSSTFECKSEQQIGTLASGLQRDTVCFEEVGLNAAQPLSPHFYS